MKLHPIVGRTACYTVIGAICAAANNVMMILGDFVGVHYLPMMLVSFGVVTPMGYLLHARFTFRERPSLPSFLRFASGVAAGFPLSLLLMAILCTGLGLPVALAFPITTIMLFVWNYASAHWAIRRHLRLH